MELCVGYLGKKVRNIEKVSSFIPFQYQGQYEDVETELYYNRFRHYSPDKGSYISQDPIGLLSGEDNFYAYVSDVNTWSGPFGLSQCSASIELERLQADTRASGLSSHFYFRHGSQTSLSSQLVRSKTGLTPDGISKNPINLTKFSTHQIQLEAVQKAIDIQSRFGTSIGIEVIDLDLQGKTVGLGYLKNTDTLVYSTSEK